MFRPNGTVGQFKSFVICLIKGFFVNANAIVEFEEWSIASIIRVGRSRRGVKTLLWITEYITKSFVIHYKGFELSQCVYIVPEEG